VLAHRRQLRQTEPQRKEKLGTLVSRSVAATGDMVPVDHQSSCALLSSPEKRVNPGGTYKGIQTHSLGIDHRLTA
jgi:hypothetical protein